MTEEQWVELIAFNRVKNKMNNSCKKCTKEDMNREKTCFWCGRTYRENDDSEEKGFQLLADLAKQNNQ